MWRLRMSTRRRRRGKLERRCAKQRRRALRSRRCASRSQSLVNQKRCYGRYSKRAIPRRKGERKSSPRHSSRSKRNATPQTTSRRRYRRVAAAHAPARTEPTYPTQDQHRHIAPTQGERQFRVRYGCRAGEAHQLHHRLHAPTGGC